MKILGYNGKTLEELRVKFHCNRCGCDFIAEYGEYWDSHYETPYSFEKIINHNIYCPHCKHQVVATENNS